MRPVIGLKVLLKRCSDMEIHRCLAMKARPAICLLRMAVSNQFQTSISRARKIFFPEVLCQSPRMSADIPATFERTDYPPKVRSWDAFLSAQAAVQRESATMNLDIPNLKRVK